jgi:FKBP-type peptidyl-prolyl cis-trans isomerase FklB
MIHLRTVAIGVVLASGVCSAEPPVELKHLNDRINYSVGYQVGSDLSRQGVEIDPAIVARGVEDALSGTEPRLTPEEMQKTLVELKHRVMTAAREKQAETAARNLAQAAAFMEENTRKDGVVTLPSGLQYLVLAKGSGTSPKATDTVTVHYRGTLIDGTEFDNSYSRNMPASFAVNRVILGWTEGLQLMSQGDRWRLFIPPNLAYGGGGSGNRIPSNSALIFEVELISVN